MRDMIELIAVALLLLALLSPPDPHLRAQWDSTTSATVSWTQQTRGCLEVAHQTGEIAFVSCYERPGSYQIELGHIGPLSGDLRPQAHDVYVLVTNGQTYRARLVGRMQYLAVIRA